MVVVFLESGLETCNFQINSLPVSVLIFHFQDVIPVSVFFFSVIGPPETTQAWFVQPIALTVEGEISASGVIHARDGIILPNTKFYYLQNLVF